MKSITDTAISRRQAIALGASAFATLGLAACGSSNSSDSLRSALSTATVLIMKAPLTMCPDATGRCDGICPNGIAA